MLMDHYALMDKNDGNSRALICYRISGGDLLLHVTIYGYLPYWNVLTPKGLDPLNFILPKHYLVLQEFQLI